MVIVSHLGPVAGAYGGKDFGTQWSSEQSFGGIAVSGFLFISGFLISRSWNAIQKPGRFLWHRFLRIFPGFWLILIVTAAVFAPLVQILVGRDPQPFISSDSDSAIGYVYNNLLLLVRQETIAGTSYDASHLVREFGTFAWNGSLWTLPFEFGMYCVILVFGMLRLLEKRQILITSLVVVVFFSSLQGLGIASLWNMWSGVQDYRILLVVTPFMCGMLVYLYRDKFEVHGNWAAASTVIAILTYLNGGWLVIGQYFFYYAILWFVLKSGILTSWGTSRDLSYGIYLVGWPMTLLLSAAGLHNYGDIPFLVAVLCAAHVYALVSWTLVEKPAMRLKGLRPKA